MMAKTEALNLIVFFPQDIEITINIKTGEENTSDEVHSSVHTVKNR